MKWPFNRSGQFIAQAAFPAYPAHGAGDVECGGHDERYRQLDDYGYGDADSFQLFRIDYSTA